MGPKSAGRSSSGPKSDEPAYPPALGCGLGTLPAGSRGLLCGSDRQRRAALRVVSSSSYLLVPSSPAEEISQQSPRLFTGWRLPKDGGFSPHPAGPASSYRAPAATRRARGRKEGDARRVAMGGGFLFSFYFYFYFLLRGYSQSPEGLHTHHPTPHVVPRAQQQQPAAGIPVKGTVYPRASTWRAGSRRPR